jgi:hypothetical protein
MDGKSTTQTGTSKSYVLGRKSFAAISAVEGLKLHSGSEQRLEQTVCLSQAQRRAATIQAFAGKQKRG